MPEKLRKLTHEEFDRRVRDAMNPAKSGLGSVALNSLRQAVAPTRARRGVPSSLPSLPKIPRPR